MGEMNKRVGEKERGEYLEETTISVPISYMYMYTEYQLNKYLTSFFTKKNKTKQKLIQF